MELKLKRYHLILIMFVLIALFYAINRSNVISNSDFTSGNVIGEKRWYNADSTSVTQTAPVIKFNYDSKSHVFEGEINSSHKTGEELMLIIRNKNPERVSVYDFTGFWLTALLYCLIPLMLVSALILTFVGSDNYLLLRFGKGKALSFKKNDHLKLDV